MKINYIILLVLLCSCGEQPELIKIDKANIQNEVIRNFVIHKNTFDSLNRYFKLNHIKVIKFPKNNLISIDYIIGNDDKHRGKWIKLENKEVGDQAVKGVLMLDSLSIDYVLQLKKDLEKINSFNFWIMNNYDVNKGKYTKAIDLRYKTKMNRLSFYYRIFQEPIDSIEKSLYSILIRHDSTGGILNNHLIWYYK